MFQTELAFTLLGVMVFVAIGMTVAILNTVKTAIIVLSILIFTLPVTLPAFFSFKLSAMCHTASKFYIYKKQKVLGFYTNDTNLANEAVTNLGYTYAETGDRLKPIIKYKPAGEGDLITTTEDKVYSEFLVIRQETTPVTLIVKSGYSLADLADKPLGGIWAYSLESGWISLIASKLGMPTECGMFSDEDRNKFILEVLNPNALSR